MTNFLFGIPKKTTSVTFSWRPVIVLGVVLSVALGMRLYQWIRGPVVPTANLESVSWDEQKGEGEGIEGISSEDGGIEGSGGIEEGEIDAGGEQNSHSGLDSEPNVLDALDAIGRSPTGEPGSESGMTETLPVVVLPDAINLAVPFTSQAPLGIWDEFTEETCEEASFLMVYEYYQGAPEGSIDPTTADTDFRAMVAAEESLGFGPSISSEQFISFAQTYNSAVARVVENPSADDLRALLAAGHPIIIPAFGRKLGNPFFTGEGPLYHMLVLRGYTPTTFIANDPGTRHGENYQYATDVLMGAIGDWDGDSPDAGSRVIVIDP